MLTKIQVWRLFPQHFIPTWNDLFGEGIPFHLSPPECNAWVSMRTETLTISFPLECPSGLQTFLCGGRGRMYKTTENQKCESLSHSFFQKIFPTQRSKLGLPNCRQILYRLNYQGSPRESKSSPTQLPPSHGTVWTQLCRNTGFPGHRQSCIREETDTHPEKPVCIPGPAPNCVTSEQVAPHSELASLALQGRSIPALLTSQKVTKGRNSCLCSHVLNTCLCTRIVLCS